MPELHHQTELFDPEVNALELSDRSERISDALDHWFEAGQDAFRPELDLEEVTARLNTGGHPRLLQAFIEGWREAATEVCA